MSTITPTAPDEIRAGADGAIPADELDPQIAALQAGGISLMETFEIALKSLTANKLRTLLTALGIIIGVAAVVALMAIGQGSQASITATITSNGANLLTVRSGASSSGGVRGQVGSSQTLTTEDAKALADPQNVPDATLVSPEYNGFGQLVAGSQNTNAQVTGAQPAYLVVHNVSLAEGEFITESDVNSMSNLVVLGANVATSLFPDGDALGQSLRISGQSFKVAGVLASKGGSGFGSSDDGVIVPLSTAQRRLFGGRALQGGAALVSSIAVQAKDADSVTAALSEIQQTLRDRHELPASGDNDDFSVINQQDILNSVVQTTQTLTLFLGAIAAISLVVGGIGIMNIMLVSVRERTREIGLRKAIGARESDILTQFMLEALTISLLGALIGLALGIAIALAVNLTGLIKAAPSLGAAALAVGFAMAIGLFFGIAPARSAAQLDPIDALRYE
ncbi:MAG: ABC transporter permease [Kouleothrix sp.]|nr:ABC transporter permease [Kouleothrix sp.]